MIKEHLNEMATVGTYYDCKICVYEGEGTIPHFHFYFTQSGNKGCICILDNSYFDHGIYNGRLNHSERKELISFLQSKPIGKFARVYGDNATNYDIICALWDANNNDNICDNTFEMPDYSTMINQ